MKRGVTGKLYLCIKRMYNILIVKANVKFGAQFAEYINCIKGVKQGDIYSPVLFFHYLLMNLLWSL